MVSRSISGWKRFNLTVWTAPLALLLAALLSYGPRLLQMGFYWDDWPYLYLFQRGGWQALYTSLGTDRPVLSALYTLTHTLLGSSPIAWQTFALLMRWLTGWAFHFAILRTWPGQKRLALAAALLFTVYPGFSQQWISVVWGNAFVLLALLFLSLGLSSNAAQVRGPRALWLNLTGLLPAAICLFSTDYFFGLELLRPLLLFVALSNRGEFGRERWARWIKLWLPYLLLIMGYAAWRLLQPGSGHGGFYLFTHLQSEPALTLAWLMWRVVGDSFLAGPVAFAQAFAWMGELPRYWKELAAGSAAAYLLGTLYARVREPSGEARREDQALLVGLAAILLAGIPVWVAQLPLQSGFPLDRYTLSLSAGVTLALAAGLLWLGRAVQGPLVLLVILLGGAVGLQNVHSGRYVQAWKDTRELAWQLVWRAPRLPAGTLLLSSGPLPEFMEDDSLTALVNWIYSPRPGTATLDLTWMDAHERYVKLKALQPGVEVEKGYPGAVFRGNTSQALVLTADPAGCLTVLDPARDQWRVDLPFFGLRALPLARPELAGSGELSAQMPSLLQPQPPHKWCYHFQSSTALQQAGEWQKMIDELRAVRTKGYGARQPGENLPFIEATLRLGMWDEAGLMSGLTIGESPDLRGAVCRLWDAAAAWAGDSDGYKGYQPKYGCGTE